MEVDYEARASTAIDAMDGLSMLLEGQAPGMSVPSEAIAPLVRVVMEAAKRVIITQAPQHPIPCNDTDYKA